MSKIRWTVKRRKVGRDLMWEGTIELLPHPEFPGGGHIALTARAHERGKALKRAASLAARVADSPVAAALPPGTVQAMKLLGSVADSHAAGKVLEGGSAAVRKFARWLT